MVKMAIWEYKGEYFYGPKYKEKYESRDGTIGLRTYIKEKAKRFGLEAESPYERDPDGEIVPYWWIKWNVPLKEVGSLSLPKNYPGDYYWIWYNGAFFKVLGETEKYVLVEVQEGNYRQADALGIAREKVDGVYYDGAEVERWWIKKSEIKMPDELGKGRYVYLKAGYYRDGVYEIVEKEGNKIRVRGKEVNRDYEYERLMDRIKRKAFPWSYKYKKWNEGNPKVWIDGEWVYYEATFDIEKMKKIRREMDGVFDFYLYGEEEVPYRL